MRVVLVTLALLATGTAFAQESAAMVEARKLLAQGKATEALAAVEKFQKDLPPGAKLFRWRHSWAKEASGRYALLGKKHAYFVLYQSRNSKMPLGLLDKGALKGTDTKYDFNEVVTCVAADSGKMLWTRRTAGHTNLMLDPDTDDLFVWRDYRPYQTPHLFRIKATTGELLVDKRLPETKERRKG